MILEKEVKMVINQYNIDYYKKVLNIGLSIGERIMVPIELLPPTSGVKITTICEYCGKHIQKQYRRYIESKNKGKICCGACKEQKILENCINKYEQRCTLLVPKYHEKMIKILEQKHQSDKYIFCPHSDSEILRQYMNKNHFEKY